MPIRQEQIEPLLQSLKAEEPPIADDAAQSLVQMGAGVVPALIEAFEGGDKVFRDQILWIIEKIGQPSLKHVIPYLAGGSTPQRICATEVLGMLDGRKAAPELIAALGDPSEEVRSGAGWAIVRLGRFIVPSLINLLSRSSSLIREGAAWCLNGIGEPAIRGLIAALPGSGDTQRSMIFDILIEMKESSVKPLISLLRRGDVKSRVQAATALGRIGDETAVGPLISVLGEADKGLRNAASESLARIGDHAFEQMRSALTRDNLRIRDAVSQAFCSAGERSTEWLLELLQSPDADVRARTVRILGIIRDPAALEALVATLLNDSRHSVRNMAAWALGELGDQRAVEPLLDTLRDPEMGIQHSLSGWALGRLRMHMPIERLFGLLADEKPVIRWRAALTLGILGDEAAVDPLLAALGDPDSLVRMRVISSLGDIASPRAIPPLRSLLSRDDGENILAVKAALSKIRFMKAANGLP